MKDLAKAALELASPYSRHLGIFNPHKTPLSVSIIGCGAIGSFVAVGLAKMGVKEQVLWDMDVVERENLPVQMHLRKSLGKPKTDATKALVEECCPEDMDIRTFGEWRALDHVKADVIVSAVDSLHVRKAIWQTVKYDPSCKILVDARIGGQMMKIYAINPMSSTDIKLYDASFPENMEGSELPCGLRGVVDVSFMATALLIRAIRRFVATGKKEAYRVANLEGEIPNIM